MELSEVVEFGEYEECRKDGDRIKFIVQTAPPEMSEEIAELMVTFFMPREPMTKDRVVRAGDAVSTNTLRRMWREKAQSGTTLIAMQIVEGEKPKLIGCNVTPVSRKDEKNEAIEGDNVKVVLGFIDDVNKRGNLYEKYGVDQYLGGFGMTVLPDYHGFNIGLRLLECRRPLCQRLGLKATGAVFTGPTSQHVATKAGFETLSEVDYATHTYNGEKPFSYMPGKIKMMGIKY